MNMARYEQETIINFNEDEKTAAIYTHNTKTLKIAYKRRPRI